MISFKNILQILIFLIFLCCFGCQSNKAKQNAQLMNIELLRGDLVLCSGNQFGEVDFGLSCKYSVRSTFNLAIALLHSFEYEEAEKAFVKVMDADPDCAMAYWGVAMSIYHSLWGEPTTKDLEKGFRILQIAKALSKPVRQEKYLEAIGAFYEDWKNLDHNTRELKYENKMKQLYKESKNDTEAAIFYSLALNSTVDPKDKSYAKQRKAGKILEVLFLDQPNHPGIAHYIIHNYDNPGLANLALPTARRYADIAPASAHAQHMPSHIFTRLGLWDESIESNLNSVASAICYAEESNMKGHWNNEIHAMDYLVYAYLQKGDNANAQKQYDSLRTMYYVNPRNISAIAYPFAAIPARIHLENKNWAEAANIELHDTELQWNQFPWQKSIFHFAKALGSSKIKDFSTAENEIDTLKNLRQNILDSDNSRKMYSANQVMIEIKASQAWLQFMKGDLDDALSLMKEASNLEENTEKHGVTPGEVLPAIELLGDMLLAMGRPSEALQAYEKNLQARPNRFNGVYGAAVAAKNIGDKEKSKMYFENLIKLTEGTESKRPEIEVANEYLSQI